MGLETFNFIDSLVVANPIGATDPKSQGDDHLRGIKVVLTNSFPSFTGAMTLTHTQLSNAAVKNELNIFTAQQRIANASPRLVYEQTTAGVDEGKFRTNVGTETFFIELLNDAEDTAVTALEIQRTGLVADLLRLTATNVQIRTGSILQIYDATNVDSLSMRHDGTNIQSTAIGATNWDVIGLTGAFRVRDGASLVILDSTDTDFVGIKHDGSDAVFDFVGTTHVDFGSVNRPTGYYRFTNDSSNDVRIILNDAGTELSWFRAVPTSTEIRCLIHGGFVELIGEDVGGNARILLHADPDNRVDLYYAGLVEFATQDHSSTGNTSGANVVDTSGMVRDVGFNVLPVFNSDASDTLEAGHCGKRNELTGANNATLTLEASGTTDFPVEGVTHVQTDTGTYTITEGAGTTLFVLQPGVGRTDSAGGATVGPGGFATIIRKSTTEYEMFGSSVAP